MSASKNGTNREIQDVYAPVLHPETVAESTLKLEDFIPAPRNVVVEPLPKDTQIGKIILPNQAQTDKSLGWVRCISPEDAIDGPYQIGDLVFFRFGAGDEIEIEGRKVVVLRYNDRITDILGFWKAETVAQMKPGSPDPA